jgi:LacI family transcriptional regulator
LTQLPVLWLNRRPPGATRYVVLDDARAAAMAVEHLIELGHRRIGHLAGPAEADTARRRATGYRRALRAAGLEVDPMLEVRGDYTPAGGAAAMAELLGRPQPPTAVFVANVASAIGALAQAAQSGVAVPDRLSVVAVHDTALAAYLTPPLTTVQMPLRELGARGVEKLFEVDATAPVQEVVDSPMTLLVRSSTAKPPSTRRNK